MPEDWEYRVVRGVGLNHWNGRPAEPEVTVQPGNFAHGVWTAVAATLAQPLRDAYNKHAEEHGCVECAESDALWMMLPAGDRVVIAFA